MTGDLVPYGTPAGIDRPPFRAPAAPAGSGNDGPRGIAWHRYIAALRRYKWLIAGLVVVGSVAGFAATRMTSPRYDVHATIWISTESASTRNTGPIRANELLSGASWPQLLSSFTVLDRVSRDVQLYLRPAEAADSAMFRDFSLDEQFVRGNYALTLSEDGTRYELSRDDAPPLESGAVGDSIGRKAGFRWAPPAEALKGRSTVRFAVTAPRDASVALRQRLQANLPHESNLLRLSLSGTDPYLEARTLNVLAREFVGQAAELKKRNLVEFAKTLEQQLSYADSELRGAEMALENFRIVNIKQPSEASPLAGGIALTRDPVMSSFFERKLELDGLSNDRIALEALLADVRAGKADVNAFWLVPAVQSGGPELSAALTEHATRTAELRAARQVYTDEHPTVRAALRAVQELESRTIPGLVSSLAAQLRRREEDLGRRITRFEGELEKIPSRTIEEERLRRNRDTRESLYLTLKGRFEEARLAEASALPDISILDSAVAPQFPSRNTAPRIIMVAFVGALLLGIALAVLLDRLDHRFRYPEQASDELGLTILGAVPNIRRVEASRRHHEEAAQVVESFRTVRLNLHNAFPGGRVEVTVSSPGVGDGKSLVCANLALSFAEAGYRTLLIDGDIRRGELHKAFNVTRRPGLVDHLLGEARVDEILREGSHERLTVIPCGTRRHRGPELLMSPALPKLLAALRPRYDAIIMDSPPLGAGVDAYVLSSALGAMILVLRSGETDRKMAHAKLELMDRMPVSILGAVLNDIRASGEFRYYSYLYGYQPDFGIDAPSPSSGVGELAGRR